MAERFDKFTERARKVLQLAQEEAQRFNHNYIGTEHLLLGLVREGEGVAAKVLANLGVDLNKVRSAVEFIIGRGERTVTGDIGLTPRAKKVIELSVEEARRLNHNYIGTEHLLLGLVREGEGIAAGVLESVGVNLARVRHETERILSTNLPQGPSQVRVERGPGRGQRDQIARLLAELETVRREKDDAISKQAYALAAQARDREAELQAQLERLERIAEAKRRAGEARSGRKGPSSTGPTWSLQDFAGFR